MNDGANALGPELMDALIGAISEFRQAGAPALLLTSAHESVFCPGWDLKRLAGAERDRVAAFLARFNRLIFDLFTYPGATGAAITGSAVGGGCLLAMCCDVRIMASGRSRIGMSELNLGVPVPATSLIMLTTRLTPGVVEEMVIRGEGMIAERAQGLGVVHKGAEPGEVVAATQSELARVASRSTAAFAATKRVLLGDGWRRMADRGPDDDRVFLDCWFSDATRNRIDRLVERITR